MNVPCNIDDNHSPHSPFPITPKGGIMPGKIESAILIRDFSLSGPPGSAAGRKHP